MRFLVFLGCLILSMLILRYTEPIVNVFGKNGWAEHYLGYGGTYTMWKLIAVAVGIGGILYLSPPAFFQTPALAPDASETTLDSEEENG